MGRVEPAGESLSGFQRGQSRRQLPQGVSGQLEFRLAGGTRLDAENGRLGIDVDKWITFGIGLVAAKEKAALTPPEELNGVEKALCWH